MKTLKKYFPDTLIIFGIAFSVYWFLIPETNPFLPEIAKPTDYTILQTGGLTIFLIGLDIAIRRFWLNFKTKK